MPPRLALIKRKEPTRAACSAGPEPAGLIRSMRKLETLGFQPALPVVISIIYVAGAPQFEYRIDVHQGPFRRRYFRNREGLLRCLRLKVRTPTPPTLPLPYGASELQKPHNRVMRYYPRGERLKGGFLLIARTVDR